MGVLIASNAVADPGFPVGGGAWTGLGGGVVDL